MKALDTDRVIEERDRLYSYNEMAINVGMFQARVKVENLIKGIPNSFRRDVARKELEYIEKFKPEDRVNLCYRLALIEYINENEKIVYIEDMASLFRKQICLQYEGSLDWEELRNFRETVFDSFRKRFKIEFSEGALREVYRYAMRRNSMKSVGLNNIEERLAKYRISKHMSFGSFIELCILSERRNKYGKEKVLCSL